MANVFSVNTKKILHSIGALIDGAYLWAGADKGIEKEMQGKNNGVTINYTISDMGDVQDTALSLSSGSTGGYSIANANDVKQRDVAVIIRDARCLFKSDAIERLVTSMGEVKAHINVGQKLVKKAIGEIIGSDFASVGNIFVGSDYTPYQTAGAYLKSITSGKLYGFIDWNAWGKLTSQGQQSVPCNLARPEFGNNLVGKWSLIDELRTMQDIPQYMGLKVTNGILVKGSISARGPIDSASSFKIDTFTNHSAGDTIIFSVPGIYNTDTNGSKTTLYKFVHTITSAEITAAEASIVLPVGTFIGTAGVADNTACVDCVGTAGNYFACLIRAEGAQCFGCANDVSCKTAKYAKETYEGMTIHTNEDSDVSAFADYKRYDMVYASKLVEPRASAIVLLKV